MSRRDEPCWDCGTHAVYEIPEQPKWKYCYCSLRFEIETDLLNREEHRFQHQCNGDLGTRIKYRKEGAEYERRRIIDFIDKHRIQIPEADYLIEAIEETA